MIISRATNSRLYINIIIQKKLKMNLGTTIIGILCVAVCAMPFALLSISKMRKEKQLINALKGLAEKQGCQLSEFEICGNYIVGIDKHKNSLFFQYTSQEKTEQQAIDLSTIQECSIHNASKRTAKDTKVQFLKLQLTPLDKALTIINLDFYNADFSYMLRGELQSIEKWKNIVYHSLVKA